MTETWYDWTDDWFTVHTSQATYPTSIKLLLGVGLITYYILSTVYSTDTVVGPSSILQVVVTSYYVLGPI